MPIETVFETHRPRLYFTNSRLHNPTGASYSSAAAFKVLNAAGRFDCLIVEDDVSAGLVQAPMITLASMDQLKRVIYVGSFSKTIGAGLRVGVVAADESMIEGMLYQKLVSGMSTPPVELVPDTVGYIRTRLRHSVCMGASPLSRSYETFARSAAVTSISKLRTTVRE
ncbi:aminotransferase class I/II-fold pyridoxal phosphate-dependent enzyme [Paraburkholderia flagellata]|uniref:aminotransferase class I/II-fold pyridoxal phosphate-dependent enzyme n=1 Tax=Paraburkholderia flagellata TaxID=2883241 RepID=UPI001F384612|nr:aminotransferase class I/II-fold pyridoxal phosphate-dependent enzyme [Paraburkholderia flagellata]